MTDVTIKTLPRAELEETVLIRGLAPERAIEAMTAAMGSSCAVSGAAHLPGPIAARIPAGAIGARLPCSTAHDRRADRARLVGRIKPSDAPRANDRYDQLNAFAAQCSPAGSGTTAGRGASSRSRRTDGQPVRTELVPVAARGAPRGVINRLVSTGAGLEAR